MKHKTRICCFFVFLLLVCAVCGGGRNEDVYVKSWTDSNRESPTESPLKLSAELLTEEKIKTETPFEVKVGIGQSGIYSAGTLEIFASGFEIMDSTGNIYNDEYIFLYEDFKDEKYGLISEEGRLIGLEYFETFQFKYKGESATERGVIEFRITTLQHGEPATEVELNNGKAGALVSLCYTVKDGVLLFTTE